MPNPFEDPDRDYLVLVNADGQVSLWPADIQIPPGWWVEHGPDARASCLRHVGAGCSDSRPRTPAGVAHR